MKIGQLAGDVDDGRLPRSATPWPASRTASRP